MGNKPATDAKDIVGVLYRGKSINAKKDMLFIQDFNCYQRNSLNSISKCQACISLHKSVLRTANLKLNENSNLPNLMSQLEAQSNLGLQQEEYIANQKREIKNLKQRESYREAERSVSAYGEHQAKLGLTCNFGNLKTPQDQRDMQVTLLFLERLLLANNERKRDDPLIIEAIVSVRNMFASIGWENKSGNQRGDKQMKNKLVQYIYILKFYLKSTGLNIPVVSSVQFSQIANIFMSVSETKYDAIRAVSNSYLPHRNTVKHLFKSVTSYEPGEQIGDLLFHDHVTKIRNAGVAGST